ncbi:MAG: cytochrome-c peroxidase [Saprospiraceae bacterium]|nr:cytochrome-c peroxidase [Saprospiraceae bacterium]
MKKITQLLVAAMLLFLANSCKKDDSASTEEIKFSAPSNLPAPTYDFSKNEVTQAGFALGRRLFYDPIFSRDSTISCGDCHISYSAFSHVDHVTSHGIDGLLGKRNAPAVQNMAWRTSFFWDGGVPNLDLVPLNAIQNPVEMDESPAKVVQKLNRHAEYRALFKKAFPEQDTVSGATMLKALSQFMVMLVSADSRYDKFVRGETGGTLSTDEIAGLNLFKQKCATCHSTDLFTDQSFRNNGILDDFSNDSGRNLVSTFPDDIGKFAVPSLRNVEKTPPYMHTGKFKTLESVLDHYASGVKDSPTLDPLLKQNGQPGIALTGTEKQQIIAFLKTLTDENFLRDARFQKP